MQLRAMKDTLFVVLDEKTIRTRSRVYETFKQALIDVRSKPSDETKNELNKRYLQLERSLREGYNGKGRLFVDRHHHIIEFHVPAIHAIEIRSSEYRDLFISIIDQLQYHAPVLNDQFIIPMHHLTRMEHEQLDRMDAISHNQYGMTLAEQIETPVYNVFIENYVKPFIIGVQSHVHPQAEIHASTETGGIYITVPIDELCDDVYKINRYDLVRKER